MNICCWTWCTVIPLYILSYIYVLLTTNKSYVLYMFQWACSSELLLRVLKWLRLNHLFCLKLFSQRCGFLETSVVINGEPLFWACTHARSKAEPSRSEGWSNYEYEFNEGYARNDYNYAFTPTAKAHPRISTDKPSDVSNVTDVDFFSNLQVLKLLMSTPTCTRIQSHLVVKHTDPKRATRMCYSFFIWGNWGVASIWKCEKLLYDANLIKLLQST